MIFGLRAYPFIFQQQVQIMSNHLFLHQWFVIQFNDTFFKGISLLIIFQIWLVYRNLINNIILKVNCWFPLIVCWCMALSVWWHSFVCLWKCQCSFVCFRRNRCTLCVLQSQFAGFASSWQNTCSHEKWAHQLHWSAAVSYLAQVYRLFCIYNTSGTKNWPEEIIAVWFPWCFFSTPHHDETFEHGRAAEAPSPVYHIHQTTPSRRRQHHTQHVRPVLKQQHKMTSVAVMWKPFWCLSSSSELNKSEKLLIINTKRAEV